MFSDDSKSFEECYELCFGLEAIFEVIDGYLMVKGEGNAGGYFVYCTRKRVTLRTEL